MATYVHVTVYLSINALTASLRIYFLLYLLVVHGARDPLLSEFLTLKHRSGRLTEKIILSVPILGFISNGL